MADRSATAVEYIFTTRDAAIVQTLLGSLLGDPYDHAFVGALTRDEADGARRAEIRAGASRDDKGPRHVDRRVRPFGVGDGTDCPAQEVEGDDAEAAKVLRGRREGERRDVQALGGADLPVRAGCELRCRRPGIDNRVFGEGEHPEGLVGAVLIELHRHRSLSRCFQQSKCDIGRRSRRVVGHRLAAGTGVGAGAAQDDVGERRRGLGTAAVLGEGGDEHRAEWEVVAAQP